MVDERGGSRANLAGVVPGIVALVGYVVLGVVSSAITASLHIPVFSSPELLILLPVPLVVAFGPRALWGVGAGVVAVDIVAGAVGMATAFGVLAHVYAGYAAHRLLKAREGEFPSVRRLVATTLVVAAGAAAIVAWGREAAHVAPFYLSAVVLTVEFCVLAGVSVVPLTRLAVRLRERLGPLETWSDQLADSRASGRAVTAVTGVWLVGGVAASLGYRTFVRLPEPAFSRRNLEVLLSLDRPDLLGFGAGRLLVAFSVVMFVVLAVLLTAREWTPVSQSS